MSGITKMFKPPKVPIPKAKDPVRMPDPDDEGSLEQRRLRVSEERAKKGRQSTRLSDRNADYSGTVLGD